MSRLRTQMRAARILGLLCVVLGLMGIAAPGAAASGPIRGGGPRPAGVDPGLTGYPNAMAATGDSITRAFNTGTVPFTDAPANSWSTGTSTTVNSQYLRILAAHSAISGHNNNDAVTGAVMADLTGQAQNAVAQGVDYVTILLGANDACTPTEAQMTPVSTFAAQFQAALDTLAAGLPSARIYVLSIPDVYNLWAILHTDSTAVTVWNTFGICQSMLQNPTSLAQPDVDRRTRVRQRVIDYNTALATICATSIHCRFDNNAVFNTQFVPSEVSTRDYFHPSIAGQTRLALVTYAATFNFADATPPVSTAVMAVVTRSTLVALTATDNIAVAGIEYRIGSGAYTRYTTLVDAPSGSTLIYRAVDVNGNVEAAHSLIVP
jgi:lysophospholipase L1-like esterase